MDWNFITDDSFKEARRMAAILLSDTSESDEEEGSEEQENGILADAGDVIDAMYKAIKIETNKLKKSENNDSFVENWIKTQEKSHREWAKRKLSLSASSESTIDDEKRASKLKHVIPKSTKIKPIVKLSDEQIKKEIAKIDKEKRERWYNEFVRRETKTVPILKSDLKKNTDLITQGCSDENLKDHYNKQLAELKSNMGDFVLRLERVMGDLEAKDVHPKTSAHGQGETAQIASTGNEESTENDRTESNDMSLASDEELNNFEQQWDDVEDVLCKNLAICPNQQMIKQLLETELVYPEGEKEVVKLGKSLAQVEKDLLDSKGLEHYQTRIVYFYFYKSILSPGSITAVYESIAADSGEKRESEVVNTQKGCLVIYENVNLCIAMVEGTEFDIMDHLNKFKGTVIFPAVKKGKILYVHHNLTKLYFSKWVTRIESPPVRKVTYLTKSKKILYRTAASRLVRMSEMLHKLYRHISKEERYIVDPKSIYIKSKYLILLPSPAMFSYLSKYDVLRNLKTYLQDLGKPLELESDDELLFAFAEDKMFSYYADSDADEDVESAQLNYAKTVISASDGGHSETIKEMCHLRVKDDGKILSWDDYQLDEINTTIVDRRVKLCDEPDHPACRLESAIERRQSRDYTPKKRESKPLDDNKEEYKMLTFLEKGSDKWPRSVDSYGLNEFQKFLSRRAAESGSGDHSAPGESVERSDGEESSECDTEGSGDSLTEDDLGSVSSFSNDETP